jgi:transposase
MSGVIMLTYDTRTCLMAKRGTADQKARDLTRTGTLNPRPGAVADALFRENPFFDPRDLLQARYEMLRRHRADALSIRQAAAAFGVSRPTFYHAQTAFGRSGLAGLLPKRRGPKGGHKLSAAVLDYVERLKAGDPTPTTGDCVRAVHDRFGLTIHRRSLERALARRKKKLPEAS